MTGTQAAWTPQPAPSPCSGQHQGSTQARHRQHQSHMQGGCQLWAQPTQARPAPRAGGRRPQLGTPRAGHTLTMCSRGRPALGRVQIKGLRVANGPSQGHQQGGHGGAWAAPRCKYPHPVARPISPLVHPYYRPQLRDGGHSARPMSHGVSHESHLWFKGWRAQVRRQVRGRQ